MTSMLKDRYLLGAGVAACAGCCATPLLALLGIAVTGTAATIATFAFFGVAFALVVGTAALAAIWVGRQRRAGCETPAGPVDLELPTAPGREA